MTGANPESSHAIKPLDSGSGPSDHPGMTGKGSKSDRHPDMAGGKSKPFVEALRIDPCFVGKQFDQLAASRLRLRDGPLHQVFADAAAAAVAGDADILDQRPRGALRAQSGQDADRKSTRLNS